MMQNAQWWTEYALVELTGTIVRTRVHGGRHHVGTLVVRPIRKK